MPVIEEIATVNVREAASYLTGKGYRCSEGTVRALAKSGRLRCYRPGVTGRGPMRFTQEQLDAFMAGAEAGVAPADAPTALPPPRRPRAAAVKANGRASGWESRLRDEWGK